MFQNLEGKRVPNVTFKTRVEDKWVDVTSDSIFKGKKVVVFSLPGAFTPTCSSTHLPRYEELAPAFKESGIDDIVCISVNDAFVMNAWQQDQHLRSVRVLPDGNGEFTKGMGMLVDKAALGFGPRSWRYAMLVDDGVVKKMFIEPEVEGDPFEVSDADTMLKHINPKAKKPAAVSIFTKPGCPYCAKAKKLLNERGWRYEEISLGKDVTVKSLKNITGKTTVPQVFVDGKHVGGSEDLEAFLTKYESRS